MGQKRLIVKRKYWKRGGDFQQGNLMVKENISHEINPG